jgi:hypothetical protein
VLSILSEYGDSEISEFELEELIDEDILRFDASLGD